MGLIYNSIDQLVGRTPLMELTRLTEDGFCARVAAKLEYFNPAGSTKDRAALFMINDAQERGLLSPGGTIIEPTSGNTGIGLAAIAAARGYKVIITMPDTMSIERCRLMQAYGAELVLTDGQKGMAGAIAKAEELTKSIPGSFMPDQFGNAANARAHYATTGPEIWEDTDGKIDILVAGVGTGGTITGIGRFLKEKNPSVHIVGVEPAGSPVLSGGNAVTHGLQGIGAGFIPGVLDTSVIDEIMTVTENEAYTASRSLAKSEGIFTGISSGAALHAALELAKLPENAGKLIVAILPDTGERYLSTPLMEE